MSALKVQGSECYMCALVFLHDMAFLVDHLWTCAPRFSALFPKLSVRERVFKALVGASLCRAVCAHGLAIGVALNWSLVWILALLRILALCMRCCWLELTFVLQFALCLCIRASPLPGPPCQSRGYQQQHCGGPRFDQGQREQACGGPLGNYNGFGNDKKESETPSCNSSLQTLDSQEGIAETQLWAVESSESETSRPSFLSTNYNAHTSSPWSQKRNNGRTRAKDPMEMPILPKIVQNECQLVRKLWNRVEDSCRSQLCSPGCPTNLDTQLPKTPRMASIRECLVELESGSKAVTKEKEPKTQQGTIQRGTEACRKIQPARRRERRLVTTRTLVHAGIAASAAFQPKYWGNNSFFNYGQHASCAFQGAGRTCATEKPCQDVEKLCWATTGGCPKGSRASREQLEQGRHKNLQGTCFKYGKLPERPRADPFHLGELQNILGEVFRRITCSLGSASTGLREGSRSLREEERRGTNAPGRCQSSFERDARENYSTDGRGRAIRRTGRASRGFRTFIYECEENEGCHEYGLRYCSFCSRCQLPEKEIIDAAKRENTASSRRQRSPSIGRTTRLPNLDEWDRPFCPNLEGADLRPFRPSRHDIHASCEEAASAWCRMKPHFVHSITAEADFKSILEAQYQGFLMEQSYFEIEFNEHTQSFVLGDLMMREPAKLQEAIELKCDSSKEEYMKYPDYLMNEEDTKIETAKENYQLRNAGGEPNSLQRICDSDIETMCQELAFDKELLEEDFWPPPLEGTHKFTLHFDKKLGLPDFVVELERNDYAQPLIWKTVLKHVNAKDDGLVLRLFRVHAGLPSKFLGLHHIIVSPWQPGQVPVLMSEQDPYGSFTVIKDVLTFDVENHCKQNSNRDVGAQNSILWQGGRKVSGRNFAAQCGSLLTLEEARPEQTKNKVGEEDIVEPPHFDIDQDEPVVLPAEVQGRDDALALMRDDEEVIVSAMNALPATGNLHLIMFGHDGNYVGRRDADVDNPTFETIQRAIELSWNDFEGYLLKSTLVQPQPPELQHDGLVFVVALQHIFAGEPVPQDGRILCLAGLQLAYAGAMQPEIHRAVDLEEVFDAADLRLRLQLNDICQPRGRRECDYWMETRNLREGHEARGRTGSYVAVRIGEERQIFDIRNSCREVDSILQDIRQATQDASIRQICLVQHGYRYRPIGRVNQDWRGNDVIDEVSLAQHFAEGWTLQPIERMKIHRAHALDAVNAELGILELHFLVSFDLIPGHAICLMLNENAGFWTMAGPHLLQPHFWDADGLISDAPNPLTDENYEILLYPGRAPTLTVQSGDVIQYVTRSDHELEDSQEEADADEESSSLIQKNAFLLSSNFVSNPASPRRATEEAYVSHQVPAVGICREPLQLFHLLGDSLPFDHGQPVPEPTIENFLDACAKIQLATFVPENVFDKLKPISQAFFQAILFKA